jgi:hypothetical protein
VTIQDLTGKELFKWAVPDSTVKTLMDVHRVYQMDGVVREFIDAGTGSVKLGSSSSMDMSAEDRAKMTDDQRNAAKRQRAVALFCVAFSVGLDLCGVGAFVAALVANRLTLPLRL